MMVIWSYLGVLYEKVFHIFVVYIDPLVKRETPLRSFADNLGLTLDSLLIIAFEFLALVIFMQKHRTCIIRIKHLTKV